MSDKAIVLCMVLAAVAVIAIVFIRRAVRYRKALGAAVPEKEVMQAANEPQPEQQPEPKPEPPQPKEPSAVNVYVSRFIFPERSNSKGGKAVHISAEYHARIKWILDEANRYGISFNRYLDGVLKVHFEDNAEVIERLFGKMPEPNNEKE